VKDAFAAVHESGNGPSATSLDVRCLIAIGVKRTKLGRDKIDANDPTRPLAARLRCTAAAPRTLAWPV
jgi:hypothetical protein